MNTACLKEILNFFSAKRAKALLIFISFLISLGIVSCAQRPTKRLAHADHWAIVLNYPSEENSNAIMIEKSKNIQMLIIDADQARPFEILGKNTLLISYISLGEAESYRDYWSSIANESWVMGENPNWKENYFVDVRNPMWKKIILDTVIPGILKKGFQGLMLDTLDTAAYLENLDPQKYKGSKEAMIELVREIRSAYPQLLLMSNNGLEILENLSPFLDGAVVESVFGTHTLDQYGTTSREDQEYKLNILKKVRKIKTLPVFDIEYVAPGDLKVARTYREESLKNHFKPYLAQKNLDDFYVQPD